ncbi:MAG: large conductance mechanosensitive channel protein MscL [Kurthia sp.]|nr:large conductance mechanosensitive channel protein MscL [Candidatus Kurthia equi]
MWQDFKDFAFRGNVLDLAVAVVIGAAFGKIISSLVDNIIMPIIAKIFGTGQFTDLTAWGIQYGAFIQSVFDFLIIAAAIFLFVRLLTKASNLNKSKEDKEELSEETSEDLLKDIRDLLREQKNR